MGAEMLRRAADMIRAEHDVCTCGQDDCPTSDAPFYLAVADLLDAEALVADEVESIGLTYGGDDGNPVIAVAHAYLGVDR